MRALRTLQEALPKGSQMNSIVEMKTNDGKMTLLRIDVYSLVINAMFIGSAGRSFVDLNTVKVFCDGVEQCPPPDKS
jgi:hypothetical protein